LGNSSLIENEGLSRLTEKIVQARKLYGPDSSYVIGLITGMEWFLEGLEGGAKTKDLIHSRILERESGKSVKVAETAPAAATTPGETLAENAWIKGLVKWFNNDKGYGFISTDSHIDVFVHWRDISSWDRSLSQGDEVEFMVTKTAKGFQAINVMKAAKEGDKEGNAGEAKKAVPVPENAGPKGEGVRKETGPEPADIEMMTETESQETPPSA
jgi:cold shock protein